MGAISNLSTAGSVVRRNPILLLVAPIPMLLAGLFVFGLSVLIGDRSGALIGWIVVILFIPFFAGGLYGMTAEALTGSTRLETFVEKRSENYVSLLGAMLLLFLISLVMAVVLIIVNIVLGLIFGGAIAVGASEPGEMFAGMAGMMIFFYLINVVLFFFFSIFIHFYDVAIVMDDTGAMNGINRSFAIVRNNTLSAIGYYLIRGIIGVIPTIPIILLYIEMVQSMVESILVTPTGSKPQLDIPTETIVLYIGVFLVLNIVLSTFLLAYKVSFYDDKIEEQVM